MNKARSSVITVLNNQVKDTMWSSLSNMRIPIKRGIKQVIKPITCFFARSSLNKIISCQIIQYGQLKIVIGAGGIYEPGWIPTDIDTLDLLDQADWNSFFQKDVIDAILAEHVWEHLNEKEGIEAAKNCFMYLKKGGYLRIAVPDGFHPDAEYIDNVKPGGIGAGAKDHKILYNYRSLGEIFKLAGFEINLLEYFDEKAVFHFKEWSPQEGMIHRSKRYDERNQNGLTNYTSIILDAKKV